MCIGREARYKEPFQGLAHPLCMVNDIKIGRKVKKKWIAVSSVSFVIIAMTTLREGEWMYTYVIVSNVRTIKR